MGGQDSSGHSVSVHHSQLHICFLRQGVRCVQPRQPCPAPRLWSSRGPTSWRGLPGTRHHAGLVAVGLESSCGGRERVAWVGSEAEKASDVNFSGAPAARLPPPACVFRSPACAPHCSAAQRRPAECGACRAARRKLGAGLAAAGKDLVLISESREDGATLHVALEAEGEAEPRERRRPRRMWTGRTGWPPGRARRVQAVAFGWPNSGERQK